MSRPCKLQINSTGAWRDMLQFDIDQVDAEVVQIKAAELVIVANPENRTTLRIVTCDGMQTALVRWDVKKGWVEA